MERIRASGPHSVLSLFSDCFKSGPVSMKKEIKAMWGLNLADFNERLKYE